MLSKQRMDQKPFDFLRFAEREGVPFLMSGHHHCHEGWVQTHCPFCGDGQSGWHLGYPLDGGAFHCWRCGGHSVWEFLSHVLRGGRQHIAQILDTYQTHHLSAPQKRQKSASRPRSAKKPSGLVGLYQVHRKYLLERGFDPDELIRIWDLRGTVGFAGAWNWRLIAPIKNPAGQIVAFTGRALGDIKPRWKTSDKTQMSASPDSLLYGIEKAEDSVLIVEGPSDVWRMGPGAVATLGIAWTEEQANILRQYRNRFILYDPEPQAQRQAKRLAEFLSVFGGMTEILSGPACDPGSLPKREANQIMLELGIRRK
jgi:hypothetical protein